MKSEHIAIGPLRGVRNSREELIEILDAVFFGGIVGYISPTVIIKIRTRRIHHAVQHHFIAMGVCQVGRMPRTDSFRLRRRAIPAYSFWAYAVPVANSSPESIKFFIFRITNLI